MTAIEVPQTVPTPPVRASLFHRLYRRPLGLISAIFLAFVAILASWVVFDVLSQPV